MAWYNAWVTEHMLFSAFIQFALLGTLGEILGLAAARRKASTNIAGWLAKALVWGILGIMIKYAFTGFKGFLAVLVEKQFLPAYAETNTFARAFALSLFTNAMFGPLLMLLHRTTDNIITGARGYAGIHKSLATLAWFWLPAHSITFALPAQWQIGLAALWSIALGIIMGFTSRAKTT